MIEDTAPMTVEAGLNYLRAGGARPVAYAFEPPPGVSRHSGELDARRVVICNARLTTPSSELNLGRAGFQLVRHRSALKQPSDFEDAQRLRDICFPETQSLIRDITGATKVVVYEHALRNDATDGGRTPRWVHAEQSFPSAPGRVRRHLPADEAERRLKDRYAFINAWRPIGAVVERSPLALCDARSIDPGDMVPTDLHYRDWTAEAYSFSYSSRHRWYYYPRQRLDEVLLLKVYDSLTDGTARLTAHTAFDDPTAAPDAPPRRSIEVRMMVFW